MAKINVRVSRIGIHYETGGNIILHNTSKGQPVKMYQNFKCAIILTQQVFLPISVLRYMCICVDN